MSNRFITTQIAAITVISITAASCSPFDLARGVYGGASSTAHTVEVINQTTLFRKHWKILNENALPNPALLSAPDAKSLEKDLQPLADKLAEQFGPLVASNPDIGTALYKHRLPRPRVHVIP